GIDVNDETMAFELIKQVGSDGHYLGKKHTLVNLKKEFYMPVLSNRESRETWIEKGKKGVVDRAREKVEKILTDYHPDPLKTDIEEKLKEYIKEVERRESNRS
ncbi:MAG TPA: trimethylamine methyltransferase, partial [Candidatus Atribacteria bacterium]|nr:trimethylamine methyltransferase [Candidatus Atribacteria bacterium]